MAKIVGTSASDTLDELDGVTNGSDTIFGFAGDDTIFGLGGADFIYGQGDDDYIKGGGGADTINGGSGVDTAFYSDSEQGVKISLFAGTGKGGVAEGDTLTGIENLVGSMHNDKLIGDDWDNLLEGSWGDDTLSGGGGHDTLIGGDGADTLKGGGGHDTLDGGAGVDTLSYVLSSGGVSVHLSWGSAIDDSIHVDTLSGIENVTGSAFGDVLHGDHKNNTLKGGGGADHMIGLGGWDSLYGGEGDDTLYGDDGAQPDGGGDYLYGEAGNDALNGGVGDDTLDGGSGVDAMFGSVGNDHFYVDNAADLVDEWKGQGTLDRVLAGVSYNLAAGEQVEMLTTDNNFGLSAINLRGNEISNAVYGNDGVNILIGRGGNDSLTGFGGADYFLFEDAPNSVTNRDFVSDFQVAVDHILLHSLVYTALAPGALAASAFHVGAAAADASDRIVYNSGTGALYYDADGTGAGAAIQFATLDAGLALTNADFQIA